jgi:hypothetical protein
VSPYLSLAFRAMDLRAFGKLIDDILTSLISKDDLTLNDKHICKLEEIRMLLLGSGNDGPSIYSLSTLSFNNIHQMILQTICCEV